MPKIRKGEDNMAIKPVSGEIKAQILNDNFSALDSNLANLSIGPFDTYTNLSALQSTYPNGRNGFAVVLESDGKTGYMYTWTGATWKKGGLAQAQGIGNDTVTRPKLATEAADYSKTDFLVHDSSVNLFDGSYFFGGMISGGTPNLFQKSTNGVYAIISVLPNTEYSVGIDKKIDRFVVATDSRLLQLTDTPQALNGAVGMNLDGLNIPTTKFTTGANDYYCYVSVSTVGAQPFLKLVRGNHVVVKKETYPIKPQKIDFLNEIVEQSDMYNLFDVTSFEGFVVSGTPDPKKMMLMERPGALSKIAEVQPNTAYTLVRTDKSRLNLCTATRPLAFNEINDGAIGMNLSDTGETIEPKTVTFTTGPNDKIIYVNNALDGTERYLGLFEGVHPYEYLPKNYTKNYKLKDFVDATTEADVLKIIDDKNVSSGKIIVVYNGNQVLKIYVPSKSSSRYLRYDYQYIDSVNANMHQWRVLKTYIVDSNLSVLFDLDSQTEWEGAIKEVGASDFMGGTHGDERNTAITFLFDGKRVDLTTAFNMQVSSVKIIAQSILNRADTPAVDLLKRAKMSTWTQDEYTVENIYTCLQDFTIEESKISLMSCRYNDSNANLINKGFRDSNYIVNGISAAGVGDLATKAKGGKMFTLFGENINMEITCVADFDKYPNGYQHVVNFNNEPIPRAKVYFDLTGRYDIKKDEILKNKSIFKIIV